MRKALQLPHATTIAETLWLAEVACMCHRRLEQTSANLWHRMDHADASRLRRELRDASDGILDAAGFLHHLAQRKQLGRYDSVSDIASDAVNCIDTRLRHSGLQLDSAASQALRLALNKVLGEADVEPIDDEVR